MKHLLTAAFVCGTLLALCIGCTSEQPKLPPRQPVRGTIKYNGQPAAGATVTFWRLPLAVDDWRAVKPMAIVEADGSFEPNSYGDKDGAVSGEYALTLIWRPSRAAPDLLNGKYADPHHPLTTVTIEEGDNELPAIELKGPPVTSAETGSPSGT